jgi:hypothetical protein
VDAEIMTTKYTLIPLPDSNGDKNYSVAASDGRTVGALRYTPRTDQWHATQTRLGKRCGRYYATEAGAAGWCLRGRGL